VIDKKVAQSITITLTYAEVVSIHNDIMYLVTEAIGPRQTAAIKIVDAAQQILKDAGFFTGGE